MATRLLTTLALTDDDNDGTPDADGDLPHDRDNDGSPDSNDPFPDDPTETTDHDSDYIGDNADNDDDNDGTPDAVDTHPHDHDNDSTHAGLRGCVPRRPDHMGRRRRRRGC